MELPIWNPVRYIFVQLNPLKIELHHSSLGPIGGAIAAGNNVVVKPCNTVPKCSELIANLLHKYMDSRFVQVIGGPTILNGDDYQITDEILQSEFDFIFFTGSTNGGKYIMEKAAKNLTPVLLELGGVFQYALIWWNVFNCAVA